MHNSALNIPSLPDSTPVVFVRWIQASPPLMFVDDKCVY